MSGVGMLFKGHLNLIFDFGRKGGMAWHDSMPGMFDMSKPGELAG